MDIVRVRYFLAVCEHGSFTAAAKACGVSQPSVTTGVRRLESAIGVELFERRHPVRLTPVGQPLRPLFEALQTAADAVAAACAEAAGRAPAGLLGRANGPLGRSRPAPARARTSATSTSTEATSS